MAELTTVKPKAVSPEYRQKVGLHVHEKVDRLHYFGSASGDASEHMVFHLQQLLPFNAQSALQEIFEGVEISEPGPTIAFKTPGAVGYFDLRIVSVRYDYPEPDLTNYRAEVQLLVEFKTLQHQVIWSQYFRGQGQSLSDTDARLSDFGRGTAYALEDAFQRVVDDMQDEVLKAPEIREYLREQLPPGP